MFKTYLFIYYLFIHSLFLVFSPNLALPQSSPAQLSAPPPSLVAQAKTPGLILDSLLYLDFTSSPIRNPIGSTFKMYPDSIHSSPLATPSLVLSPPWSPCSSPCTTSPPAPSLPHTARGSLQVPVLVSRSCYNKLPQIGWPETNLFSHSSGDQKPEIKVLAGPHSLQRL